jgi:hypothetical protein
VGKQLLEIAKKLAEAHREADPATQTIKLFPPLHNQEIHLLEVSSTAPTSGEVLPFRFAPDAESGVEYPSVVILLSPKEWEEVESGTLSLPEGWSLAEAEDL